MPSVAKSNTWFVRITGPHDWLKEKVKVILGWIDTKRILGCLHNGDKKENPHCHFVIDLSTELQKQSFDTRIKKVFDVDRGNYSSKVWDGGDGACGYMFHESDDSIFCNKGFSDEDIERFRELNRAHQKVIAVNKEKASHKFIDRAMKEFEGTTPHRLELVKYFVKLVHEGEIYYPGMYRMKQMVEEVRIKMTPVDKVEALGEWFYENMYR